MDSHRSAKLMDIVPISPYAFALTPHYPEAFSRGSYLDPGPCGKVPQPTTTSYSPVPPLMRPSMVGAQRKLCIHAAVDCTFCYACQKENLAWKCRRTDVDDDIKDGTCNVSNLCAYLIIAILYSQAMTVRLNGGTQSTQGNLVFPRFSCLTKKMPNT